MIALTRFFVLENQKKKLNLNNKYIHIVLAIGVTYPYCQVN
jgi:hypothetical protein